MKKVLVLGSTGMLGRTISRVLADSGFKVLEVNRSGISVIDGSKAIKFDAEKKNLSSLLPYFQNADYCVNGIGLIRQLIQEDNPKSVKSAMYLNCEFSQLLDIFCANLGVKVIQITTDCVFSGKIGSYSENSSHDPVDVYGISKSRGEFETKNMMKIRCSIVGKENVSNHSLLSWFLSRAAKATIQGYQTHFWNGVTTLHFSLVVAGIIHHDSYKIGNFHLVPSGSCTKYELLTTIGQVFDRPDIKIEPISTQIAVDRRLTTIFPEQNRSMWMNAGFSAPPTIPNMLEEYASWELPHSLSLGRSRK